MILKNFTIRDGKGKILFQKDELDTLELKKETESKKEVFF